MQREKGAGWPLFSWTGADGAALAPSVPSGGPDGVELTILMPCLNEARTVAECVKVAGDFLRRSGIRGEVLVADNGSTDGSQALAEAAGARVVPVGQRGYGAALLGGIGASRGKYGCACCTGGCGAKPGSFWPMNGWPSSPSSSKLSSAAPCAPLWPTCGC